MTFILVTSKMYLASLWQKQKNCKTKLPKINLWHNGQKDRFPRFSAGVVLGDAGAEVDGAVIEPDGPNLVVGTDGNGGHEPSHLRPLGSHSVFFLVRRHHRADSFPVEHLARRKNQQKTKELKKRKGTSEKR